MEQQLIEQQQNTASTPGAQQSANQTSGLFSFGQSSFLNSDNPNSPLTGSLSSLTSQFSSGIASLKLTASNLQTNKFTSKFMNPFS